ncbi:MAG: heavy metal translocating P-type ATPase [Sedimentitalea sp.]
MSGATQIKQQVFKVEGMDCGSCAATLTKALSGLPGVHGVDVSVARARLTLSHDPAQTPVDTVAKTVRGLGFVPSLQPTGHDHNHDHGHSCSHETAPIAAPILSDASRQFRIEGMDCASCAATITSALDGIAGVSNASVSVAREILTVDLQTPSDQGDVVERTVRSLGFGITPLGSKKAQTPRTKTWWNTPKTRHLGLSVVLGLAAYLGSVLMPSMEHALFTIAVAFALFPIARRAIVAARLGAVFTIQMLMTVAAIGAVVIGEQTEALLVVVLFMVGEFLEGLAGEKARSGIKALGALLPRDAWLLVNDTPQKVHADTLAVGQSVLVRPGDRIPADGVIIQGFSSIDESPVTGESVPVSKGVGQDVFAGTVLHDAALHLRVTQSAQNNTIARIITMVEEAQDAKAPTERFIESFSKIYMPIIIAIAVLVAIVPPLSGMGTWDTWTYRALALLLIGCPCALVISVPAAIAASLSAGARHGILIKGGAVIEEIARAKTVVFDKTGTLTKGKPEVTDVVAFSKDETSFLARVKAVEQGSSHPLAEAICAEAGRRGIAACTATDIRVVPGKGMEARIDGTEVFVGAPRFAKDRAEISDTTNADIAALEQSGKTVAVVTQGSDVLGLIALRDDPRATTRAGLSALKHDGIKAIMMTGDNHKTAAAIGADLGIEVQAEMLPEDKAAKVRALAAKGHVMMVGDGVNDAPALAEAHVGIALGSGTDVAMEASDAAIMRNDINDVARMSKLARATIRNIRQNVIIALGLKAIFLVTTITGLSGLWMAVLADTGATVLVTLNAMRLLGYLGPKSTAQVQGDVSELGTVAAIRP